MPKRQDTYSETNVCVLYYQNILCTWGFELKKQIVLAWPPTFGTEKLYQDQLGERKKHSTKGNEMIKSV